MSITDLQRHCDAIIMGVVPKYKKELDFTYKIHFKQNRKGTGIPYFTHLVSVSNNIIEDSGTTDEAIGGLLHDAVEDQGGLRVLKEIKKVKDNRYKFY